MAEDVLENLKVRVGYELEQGAEAKVGKIVDRLAAGAVAKGQLIADALKAFASGVVNLIGSAVHSLVGLVEEFGAVGAGMVDAGKKLGIGTTELQKLRFAAERSGSSAGVLDNALKKLNVGLTEARTKGTGPFAEGLGLLGVKLDELEGKSRSEQIGLLGEALNDIADPAEKAAIASRLFGEEAGPALQELLSGGRKGIEALGDQAERLGLVLGEDAVGAADRLDDSLQLLKMQATVLGAKIAGNLAPYVSDAAERFSEWIDENDAFIEQDLPEAISAIATALADLVVWLVDVVHEFKQFGREVGFAWEEASKFASELKDELQPAIDAVSSVVEVWAEAFVGLNKAIGDGIATVLEYVGVLDVLKAAWDKLPFTGESVDELTQRLHGGTTPTRKAPGFTDETAERMRVDREGRKGIAEAAIATAAANQAALFALFDDTVDEQTPEERRRRRKKFARSLKKGGGGGGSKSSGGVSTMDSLNFMWSKLTGTPEPGLLDQIGSAIGLGGEPVTHTAAGGGGSPLSGATFNRIDASFNAPTTVEVVLPESMAHLNAAELGRTIGDMAADALSERNRKQFDHWQQVLRGL